MTVEDIHVGSIVSGPLLPEPVEVLAVVRLGASVKLIAKGCKTGLVRDPVLTPELVALLTAPPVREPSTVRPLPTGWARRCPR